MAPAKPSSKMSRSLLWAIPVPKGATAARMSAVVTAFFWWRGATPNVRRMPRMASRTKASVAGLG